MMFLRPNVGEIWMYSLCPPLTEDSERVVKKWMQTL